MRLHRVACATILSLLPLLAGEAQEPAPAPSPAPAATAAPIPDVPDSTAPLTQPDQAPPSEALPPEFSDPGTPPPVVPTITPNIEDVAPSAATIKKMNENAVAMINAFIKSQHNPKVPDMTLDNAISSAMQRNPDVLAAVEQIRLTRGQYVEVRAQALPQLTATAAYTQQALTLVDPKRPSTGGTITIPTSDGPVVLDVSGGVPFLNDKSYNVGFGVSQLLYAGGGVKAGIRAARFVEDSANFLLRQTVNQVIADVKTAFYQVVLNRTLIVAQQQSVELLSQQLKDQENRYEAGTVPRFNVLQAEVALANAQPPLLQAQNNFRVSQYQLVRLLGMDYKPSRPSEVPFNVVGDLGYRVRTINTDESIRTAIERNPALKAQRQNLLAQAENVKVQFAGYLPTVSATAGYGWQNNTAFQNLGQVTRGWTFGFQGSWAIFDGFATKGRVQQANAQLEQAVIAYNNGVRQIILDVQQAISNLQTALETVQSQEASVVQAGEAFRLSQERLDAGAGTQLDVLNAQTQLLTAQTNVLTARYDYINALAQYNLALSLDAEYEEVFDDPLAAGERKQFRAITNPTAPQPPLPRQFQGQDPIAGFAPNAPPTPPPTPTPAPAAKSAGGTESSNPARKSKSRPGKH